MAHDAERPFTFCHGCQVVGEFHPPEPMKRTEPSTGPWQRKVLFVVADCSSEIYEVVIMRSTISNRMVDDGK